MPVRGRGTDIQRTGFESCGPNGPAGSVPAEGAGLDLDAPEAVLQVEQRRGVLDLGQPHAVGELVVLAGRLVELAGRLEVLAGRLQVPAGDRGAVPLAALQDATGEQGGTQGDGSGHFSFSPSVGSGSPCAAPVRERLPIRGGASNRMSDVFRAG